MFEQKKAQTLVGMNALQMTQIAKDHPMKSYNANKTLKEADKKKIIFNEDVPMGPNQQFNKKAGQYHKENIKRFEAEAT